MLRNNLQNRLRKVIKTTDFPLDRNESDDVGWSTSPHSIMHPSLVLAIEGLSHQLRAFRRSLGVPPLFRGAVTHTVERWDQRVVANDPLVLQVQMFVSHVHVVYEEHDIGRKWC